MTSLDQKGVEVAHAAYHKTLGGLLEGAPMENAITAYLAALPPQDDGLEVVAWRYCNWDSIGVPLPWSYTEFQPSPDHSEVEPLVRQSEAAARLSSLSAEVERCHARLEIDHFWVMGENDDADLERRDVPMEFRLDQIDGIECRDATISCLQKDIATLTAENEALRRERDAR